MAIKKKMLWGSLLGAGVVVIGVSVYLFSFARVETTTLCSICHMIYFDTNEYAFNTKLPPKPRGVLAGCPECHRSPFREYKGSDHSTTEEELRPGCTNCHQPHGLVTFARYMFPTSPFLGTAEAMMDSLDWEKDARPRLAMKVREGFLKDSGKRCTDCHKGDLDWDEELEPHQIAGKEKMTCIECHFNLVHKETPWPEKEAKKEELGFD